MREHEATIHNGYKLILAEDKECADYVTAKLIEFNRLQSPRLGEGYELANAAMPLQVFALDEKDDIIGGLIGETRNLWGWLEIAILWVDEVARGQGIGTQLILRGEAEAQQRGCRYARLSTFDFQARGFYEKLGYTLYGSLPDYPPGHTVYYLHKHLIKSS